MKTRKGKNVHKIGSFALTAMLLLAAFAVFPMPAAASGEIVSIASAYDVAPGSTIMIPISIASVTEITGLSVDLVYDTSVVTVASITSNNSVFISSVTVGGPEGNKAIALTNAESPDYITTIEDTPIIDVTFNVVGTPGSSTTLDLQNVMLSDTSFGAPFSPETVNDGEVKVAGEAPAEVVINEFEQNPPGDDAGNEWVELYNNGSTKVNIGGWKLVSGRGGYIVTIPDGTEIAADDYWVTNWTISSLYNSDENVTLYNATDAEVDKTLTASDGDNDDNCWARFPNGIDTDSDSDWRFQVSTRAESNGAPEDTEAPIIQFIEPPTPANNSINTTGYVNITVSVTDPAPSSGIDTVILVWKKEEELELLTVETEELMMVMYAVTEGEYFWEKSNLENGTYIYRVQANDTAGNTNVSETRVVTVDVTGFDPWSYDKNHNGKIEREEAIDAVQAYYADEITKDQAIDVIQLYFSS